MQQTGKFQSSPSLSSEYVEKVGVFNYCFYFSEKAESGDKVTKAANQTENLMVTKFCMGCNSSTGYKV